MKKCTAVLLSVLLLLGTIAFSLPAGAEGGLLGSGACGDNLTWTLDKNYRLTISGTGAMTEFPENEPWDDVMIDASWAALGYTREQGEALMESMEEMSTEAFRLSARFARNYVPARGAIRFVFEEGVTSIAKGSFSILYQPELTLPASLREIKDSQYAHSLEKITVLGRGTVEGLEVPACKKTAIYPQTLDEYNAAEEFSMAAYYLGVLVGGDALAVAENDPEMTEQERQEQVDAICAYYAAVLNVPGETKDELFASLLALINRNLGTDFTIDEIFIVTEENGEQKYTASQAYLDAVVARFGYPSDVIVNLGSEDYCTYSVRVEELGDEFVAVPWFTFCAPAGSATEALALEKGINFVAIPSCPVSDDHIVTEKDAVPATCTEAGHTAGWYCTDCGAWLNGQTVDPLAHQNASSVAATEATATAHGYTAGTYCPDCGTWLTGHDVIHNHLGAQTIIKAPTDTEEGLVEIVCTVCGESGVYTASKTEPKPTDDGGDSGDSSGGFWQKIQTFTKGVIKWFLQLFKWLGKK